MIVTDEQVYDWSRTKMTETSLLSMINGVLTYSILKKWYRIDSESVQLISKYLLPYWLNNIVSLCFRRSLLLRLLPIIRHHTLAIFRTWQHVSSVRKCYCNLVATLHRETNMYHTLCRLHTYRSVHNISIPSSVNHPFAEQTMLWSVDHHKYLCMYIVQQIISSHKLSALIFR